MPAADRTAAAWDADLPQLAATDFAPFFDDGAAAAKNVTTGIDRDLRLARRVEKRRLLNLLHVANAAAALDSLPAAGETYHIIAGGSWPAFALIGATLRLAPRTTIRRLCIGTLSFSRDNATELAALLAARTVAAVDFIYSVYFKHTSKEEAAVLHEALAPYSARVAALRFHAKVIALELTDGRAFVYEGSANLRSCSNVEQFAITHDRALFDFTAAWFDDLLTRAAEIGEKVISRKNGRRATPPPTPAADPPADPRPRPAPHDPRPQTKTRRPQAARRQSRKTKAQPRPAPAGRRRAPRRA